MFLAFMVESREQTANLWYSPFCSQQTLSNIFCLPASQSHLCLLLLPIPLFPQGGVKFYDTAGISNTAGPRIGQWYEGMLTSDHGSSQDKWHMRKRSAGKRM